MRKLGTLPLAGSKEADTLIEHWRTCSLLDLVQLAKQYGYVDCHSLSRQMRKRYGVVRWQRLSETPTEYVSTDYKLPSDATWKEHLEAIRAMDRLVAFHQQVPEEINISIDTKLPIGFVSWADWHLGGFGTDYDSFEDDAEIVRTEPGLYAGIGGDTSQNIIQPSKIGSSHNQTPISVQKGLVYLTYKRLIEKILYVGTGNHNYWSALLEGEDWDGELAKRLNLVYTKHCATINLRVGQQEYKVVRMHKGRFNSTFNPTHSNKQNQRVYFPDARIIVVEHNHIADIEQYRYNGKECVAIRTGTYAVYDDFAQQNGYFGAHVANPTVILYPDQDKIVAFKDMQDAIIFLRAARRS